MLEVSTEYVGLGVVLLPCVEEITLLELSVTGYELVRFGVVALLGSGKISLLKLPGMTADAVLLQ
jgi:hypothetical protein